MDRNLKITVIVGLILLFGCIIFTLVSYFTGFSIFSIKKTNINNKNPKETSEETSEENLDNINKFKFVHYDINGYDMPNTPIQNITSDSACHQLCQANKDCMISTWTDNNKCYLKTGDHNDTNIIVGSGFQYDNIDIPDFNINKYPFNNVESPEQCRNICTQYPECHFASYNPIQKKCWLKKGNKNSHATYQFKQNL